MNDVNFIINPFLKLCRVCTQQKQELNDLFTTFMHNNNSLAETLAHCTQRPIAVDDGFSALICIDCMVNLIAVFEFQTLCAASETKVREFITANSQKICTENDDEPTPAAVDHCADTQLDEIKDEILCNKKTNIDANDTTNSRPIEDVGNNWRRKSFECLHCKKLFPKIYNLRRHIRIHDETGKPFECPVCRWRFSSANNLKRHAIKHTIDLAESTTRLKQSTSFPCRLCERIFPKKESLASHMKIHKNNAPPDDATAKQRLSCEFCSKNFSKAQQLMRHIRGHDEMKSLQCNICSKRLHNGTLIDHMNRHNNIKPHQCPHCIKSFHQSSSLKEHLRTHNGATPYLCSQCGKVFNNRSNLRQHVIRHSDQKPYLCNQCPSRFSCRAGLRSHLNCHSGLKPHVCDTCGSTFTKASSLVKHNRIHSGIRPFPCEMCDMRFTCSDHLKRHKRTHTGEKPYKCKYCDRAFAQSNDLVKHTRIHVGENTYQCLLCTSAFRLQSELRAHATIHYQQSDSTDHTYCTA